MRFCFINYYLYNLYHPATKEIFGGAETQLYFLIEELKQQLPTAEFDVISLKTKHRHVEQSHGINFWKIRDIRNRRFLNFVDIIRLCWYLQKINADYYIIRAACFEVGLVAMLCRFFGKKFIFMTAHAMDVNRGFERNNGAIAAWFYRYGLKQANLILAQNQEHVTVLKQNYGVKAHLLPNSYRLPHDINTAQRNYILWVGRAHKSKQPHYFLQLAKALPQERFVMILNPQEQSISSLITQKAAQLPNVQLIHGVSFQEVEQYFTRAKVFVNTSSAEGFPNTFIQAAMYACPIVSLTVNPDNILNHYHIGECADNNQERLYQLVAALVNDPDQCHALGTNGRRYVEERHDIKKNIVEFTHYLKQIMLS